MWLVDTALRGAERLSGGVMESAVKDGDGVSGEVDPVSVDGGADQAGTGGRLQPGAAGPAQAARLCGTLSRTHQ